MPAVIRAIRLETPHLIAIARIDRIAEIKQFDDGRNQPRMTLKERGRSFIDHATGIMLTRFHSFSEKPFQAHIDRFRRLRRESLVCVFPNNFSKFLQRIDLKLSLKNVMNRESSNLKLKWDNVDISTI
jgi:hypothetical protein